MWTTRVFSGASRSPSPVRCPGYFWPATMGAHVVCKSGLELGRRLPADLDPVVAAVGQVSVLRQELGRTAVSHAERDLRSWAC
jgi:hypothetical protein